ncbi:MAG: hypothetical protein WA899_22900 [Candidatus Sulfotelmatobacter sp.]
MSRSCKCEPAKDQSKEDMGKQQASPSNSASSYHRRIAIYHHILYFMSVLAA